MSTLDGAGRRKARERLAKMDWFRDVDPLGKELRAALDAVDDLEKALWKASFPEESGQCWCGDEEVGCEVRMCVDTRALLSRLARGKGED